MSIFTIESKCTRPIDGQKPGTSGLRKPTKIFMQTPYTENFIQSILNAVIDKSSTSKQLIKLLLGGDGRYFVKESLTNIIIPICLANGVNEIYVAQDGIISTPAASHVIKQYGLSGGILLTASHNPGGPDADFGIKYNCENGGPAPEKITNLIFGQTQTLTTYQTIKEPLNILLNQEGSIQYRMSNGTTSTVTIINGVKDYAVYMSKLFDFNSIRNFITGAGGNQPFKMLASGLHGVTGPYIREIFCNQLGLPPECAIKADILEDFGGQHPDPNLTYAADLVSTVVLDPTIMMAAAFDGDGDRNMIIGQNGFFVSPCDSLAVICDNLNYIKYFQENPAKGFARSMPTSRAIDCVCKVNGIKCYEVPTGWKFFGNLMDAGLCSVCGEESFGTGSDHIREKDGLWAVLAWLSILAGRSEDGLSVNLQDVLYEHWARYGRYVFTRYDFENCESVHGDQIMTKLNALIAEGIVNKVYNSVDGHQFTGFSCDNFSYTDPVDHSHTTNQGIRLIFTDDTRFVFRLSGTGSSGATLRIYVDTFESDPKKYLMESKDYLKPHIALALKLCGVYEITGRNCPTVIT